MGVKRKLQLNEIYQIQEVLPPLSRDEFVGYRCRLTMQLADDSLPRHFLSVEAVPLNGPQAGKKILLQGVRLRLYEGERPICRCRAYSFPHHRGGGSCYSSLEGPFCGACGKPTEKNAHDDFSSKCCGEDLYSDCELKRLYTERY